MCFFSQAGKVERERLSCAMFLRALGVPFSGTQLIAVLKDGPPEYVDVKFGEARFQVCELLNENRRRHDEAKARAQRLRQALQDWRVVPIRDVVEPRHPPSLVPSPMSHREVYARLSEALAKKASHYGSYRPNPCAALDALGVIQLTNVFLDQASPLPDSAVLWQQGWRSVSFIMPPYSHVVYATDTAPAFLQEYVGQTRRQWEDGATFFRP